MLTRLLLLFCLLLSSAACKKSDAPIAPAPTASQNVQIQAPEPVLPLDAPPFLTQPIPTTVIEATNEALPIWRSFAKNRPALIIVANTPAMFAIPAELRTEVDALMNYADDQELIKRSSPNNPDPLLLPIMSLNAALDAGWFSQVIWIFPTKQPAEELELATFQQQLVAAQIATPEEAAGFTLNQGSFKGIIRSRPFTAAPPGALPPLEQSALLHIDTDYFKPLYSGEIKTPLYPLMVELLNKIKAQNWKVASATVALSNQQFNGLPLQTRFLGKDLAAILQNPRMFQEAFPSHWERRGNALYLENFMQKEEIHKIYLEMAKKDPTDAAVKFGLYNISRQLNKPDKALTYLHAAVQIDSVYALEYFALSELAMQKNRPEKAVEMMQLARRAQPDNPFVLTQTMRILLNAALQEEAQTLKQEFAALHWSKIYYPEQVEAQEALVNLLEEK